MKNVLILLSLTILFSSCSMQYSKVMDHYTHISFNERQHKIKLTGKRFDGPDKVEQLTLYATSRFAIEKGYPYFVILGENVEQTFTTSQITSTRVRSRTDLFGNTRSTISPGANVTTQKSKGMLNVYLLTEDEYQNLPTPYPLTVVDASYVKKTYYKPNSENQAKPQLSNPVVRALLALLIIGIPIALVL